MSDSKQPQKPIHNILGVPSHSQDLEVCKETVRRYPSNKIQIGGIIECSWNEIVSPFPETGILYVYHGGGKILGLNWSPNELRAVDKLKRLAQKQGATHNGRYWEFPHGAADFFQKMRSQVLELKVVDLQVAIEDCRFAVADLGTSQMLVVSLPMPEDFPCFEDTFPSEGWQDEKEVPLPGRHWLLQTNEDEWIAITQHDHIKLALQFLQTGGAKNISSRWDFRHESKVHLQVVGWAVVAQFDLSNPNHYLFQPSQRHTWDGSGCDLKKTFIPWNGEIPLTRKGWPNLETKLAEARIAWDGDDPVAPMSGKVNTDYREVLGWETPAPNGFLLHPYQKEGVQFCSGRGMRALIADEMGIGKTAQAIGAAMAMGARKILVVVPANARWVWDREIKGWTGSNSIQHIMTTLAPLENVQWKIATYDVLIDRPSVWILDDQDEKIAVESVIGALKLPKGQSYPVKVKIRRYFVTIPVFRSDEKRRKWDNAMRRLKHELLTNLVAQNHDLIIVDEAHRIKNQDAKRSIVLMELSRKIPRVLLLTGTPMRNNPAEAAVLLGYLDEKAGEALAKKRGYTLQDLQDNLAYYMIRRLKSEVLPQLPKKIRQVQEIDDLDAKQMENYQLALIDALRSYDEALRDGDSENEAREAMRGGIERARTFLGLAKIIGGQVLEIIVNVIEEKKSVVVFCAHHNCSDVLKEMLIKLKYSAEVVDGRTPQLKRAEIERKFQAGELQVFIGGLLAAGEAITLTAADTVIFTELDWVPAVIRQAEDRIHRIGQERGCHIIHLLAHGENLDSTMGRILLNKVDAINEALKEMDHVFGAERESQLKATFNHVLAHIFEQRPFFEKIFAPGD